jgi:hypothetical protein
MKLITVPGKQINGKSGKGTAVSGFCLRLFGRYNTTTLVGSGRDRGPECLPARGF